MLSAAAFSLVARSDRIAVITVAMKLQGLPAAVRMRLPAMFLYAGTSATMLLGVLAQFLAYAVLARYLGVVQFGQLVTITAATNMAAHVCGLGANDTAVRQIARDPNSYPVVLGHNLILTFGSALVLVPVMAVGLALYVPLTASFAFNASIMLLFVISNVVLFRLITFAEQTFVARQHFKRANGLNLTFAVSRALVAAIACIGFGVDDVATWSVWNIAGQTGLLIICVIALWPYGPPTWRLLRHEIPIGIHFTTPRFFWALRQNADLFVLNLVAPPAAVGAYAVARRLVETALVTISALNRIVYPKLAIAGRNGAAAALGVMMKYLGPAIALGVLTSLGMFILAPWLPLLFGEDFQPSVGYLQILCWVMILYTLESVASDTLVAADRHGLRATVYNSGALVAAALIGGATYVFAVPGAMVAIYAASLGLAIALWTTLIWLSRQDARNGEISASADDGREQAPPIEYEL